MYTTVTLVVVLLLMRFAFKTIIMGTAKISLSCGVVVIVCVVVMPTGVRNSLKPATASRLLKHSNQTT